MAATPVSNGMSIGRLHPSFPDSRRRQLLDGRGLLAGGGGNGYLRALGRLDDAPNHNNLGHSAADDLNNLLNDVNHDIDHTASDFHNHSFDVNDRHSPRQHRSGDPRA